MDKKEEEDLNKFIWESNAIENVKSQEAFDDSYSAWRYIQGQIDNFTKISIPAIERIHSEVMRRLQLDIAGKFRDTDMVVGGGGKITGHKEVQSQMENWIRLYSVIPTFGRASTDEGKGLIAGHIKKAHIAFENIHPFYDGNGRVGRLIMLWQRVVAGLPIEIIYERQKEKYYEWFREGNGD